MINVLLLTEEQKTQLENQYYKNGVKFYPIQDADNNWIISLEEMDGCDNQEFNWIKNLPQIEYNPIPDTGGLIVDNIE